MKRFGMFLCFAFAATTKAAEPDYLPLQVGNQWVLQTRSGSPEVQQIEVVRSRTVNGQNYFLVTGYLPQDRWLRETEGAVYALDEVSGEEILITRFTAGSGSYRTPLSGCEQTAMREPESVSYRGPYIDAEAAIVLRYTPDQCRDIGLTREIYAAGVGPVSRSNTSFRGERRFDLIYARVNGMAIVAKSKEVVLHSNFSSGSKGWLAGFSDYSVKTSDLRRLAELRPLPAELSASRSGYYIQSMNRSDDVFMFLKKQVATEDGLEPNQSYRVAFELRLASNAPTGCLGVGGAPGESVYLKAGASLDEPLTLLSPGGDVQVSIDKGQQAEGGRDAGLIGTIENGLPCDGRSDSYVTLHRQYAHPQEVRTDERGSLWLVVGTDSGYEGLTGLYFDSITARILPASDPAGARRGRQ